MRVVKLKQETEIEDATTIISVAGKRNRDVTESVSEASIEPQQQKKKMNKKEAKTPSADETEGDTIANTLGIPNIFIPAQSKKTANEEVEVDAKKLLQAVQEEARKASSLRSAMLK